MQSPRTEHRAEKLASSAGGRFAERRGFTLLEILVVIVILSLIATLVMPRLAGNNRRRALVAAEQVSDMLSMFAHRTMITADQLAVAYDADAGMVMIIQLVGDPTDPGNPARWEFDPYSSQVRLPDDMIVASARRDGRIHAMADQSWFIPIMPGEGRPNIEIDLVHLETRQRFTVYLASFEVAAKLIQDGEDLHLHRLPADLDELGRSREAW